MRLDNPIITRELRGSLRGNRAIWAYTGYALALGAVFAWAWTSARPVDIDALLGNARPAFASTFVGYWVTSQVLLLVAAVTLRGAGSFAREREQQALDSLYAAQRNPSGVIFGQVGAALVAAVPLFILGLPFYAAAWLLGGVYPSEYAAVLALLPVCVLLAAVAAVGCSLYARTTGQALVLACGVSLLIGLGGAIVSIAAQHTPTESPSRSYLPVVLWAALALLGVALAWADILGRRIALTTDGTVAWRPRAWWLLAVITIAIAMRSRSMELVEPLVVLGGLGLVALMVLLGGEDLGRTPTRWWQIWRHAPASAPAFLVVLAGVAAALSGPMFDGLHWPHPIPNSLIVALACVLWGQWLHLVLGRQTTAALLTGAGALFLLIIYGGTGAAAFPIAAAVCGGLLLGLRVYTDRQTSAPPANPR